MAIDWKIPVQRPISVALRVHQHGYNLRKYTENGIIDDINEKGLLACMYIYGKAIMGMAKCTRRAALSMCT